MQLLHGHVQLVAAGVFEHHELAVLAGDLHDLQPDVPAHAVLFVDHRRTRAQRGQVAQDGLGIGLRAPAPAFLPGALAEELRLAEHGDRRRNDVEPGHLRRDAQRECRLAVDEFVPAGDSGGFEPVLAQHLEQDFAAAGRVRGQQDASGKGVEEILERRERPLGAQVHAPFLRRGGGEVESFRFIFDLETFEIDAREGVEPRLQLLGRQVQLFGREHRAFDIVPPFLVSLGDAACGALHGGGHVRAGAHHRIRR